MREHTACKVRSSKPLKPAAPRRGGIGSDLPASRLRFACVCGRGSQGQIRGQRPRAHAQSVVSGACRGAVPSEYRANPAEAGLPSSPPSQRKEPPAWIGAQLQTAAGEKQFASSCNASADECAQPISWSCRHRQSWAMSFRVSLPYSTAQGPVLSGSLSHKVVDQKLAIPAGRTVAGTSNW